MYVFICLFVDKLFFGVSSTGFSYSDESRLLILSGFFFVCRGDGGSGGGVIVDL